MHPVLCALKQQAALQFSESCLGDFGWPEVGDFEVAIGALHPCCKGRKALHISLLDRLLEHLLNHLLDQMTGYGLLGAFLLTSTRQLCRSTEVCRA